MDMRKIAGVFVVAVLVPTLLLAWLAMRSLRNQEIISSSQSALLYQGSTEALASDLNTFMDDIRVFYDQLTDDLMQEVGPDVLANQFDQIAPMRWGQCSVAAVVSDQGDILCPQPNTTDPLAQAFLQFNGPFLLNKTEALFYPVDPVDNKIQVANDGNYKVQVAESRMQKTNPMRRLNDVQQVEQSQSLVQLKPTAEQMLRNVNPSQTFIPNQASYDNLNTSQLDSAVGNILKAIEGDEKEGALSRFQQDGLHVLLWKRHPDLAGRILWVELDLDEVKKDLSKIVAGYQNSRGICLAVLDSQGELVAKSHTEFEADWSRPFVASEVGQILPHWEVAAYLLDPGSVTRSARTAKLMVWLLVPTLLSAIGIGTFLIFRSIGSEMRLARQKTDFVSNVSHELRTPLTSIRMFSDLLTEEARNSKDREYSGIISREAARLTRLINNLLDFSRLERSDYQLAEESIDLAQLTKETVETYRFQLEADGCSLDYQLPATENKPVWVAGDRDALSQVLLNLLSNAEKYGGNGEIEVRLLIHEHDVTAEWQVLDRGPGIDRRHSSRIFDKFYRVDDSLSNGIQGSGLGLALVQQIVSKHNGKVRYKKRPKGGSCFSVILPVSTSFK